MVTREELNKMVIMVSTAKLLNSIREEANHDSSRIR